MNVIVCKLTFLIEIDEEMFPEEEISIIFISSAVGLR